MKSIVELFEKITDAFNLGRIVFYSASGAVLILPLVMTGGILTRTDHLEPTLSRQLRTSFSELLGASGSAGWALVVASIVVGFLWATVLFVELISDMQKNVELPPDGEPGFARHYPLLRNRDDEDYNNWLVAEYFRFVEVAAHLPLALVTSATGMVVYAAVYGWCMRATGRPLPADGEIGVGLLFVLAVLGWVFWVRFWKPRVLVPTVQAYVHSKRWLIAGVEKKNEERKKETKGKEGATDEKGRKEG